MADRSFPRSCRLLRAAEFKAVLTEKCSSKDRLFVIYARENRLARSRIGITVSKRTSRKAVQRNLLKRLVRESFRYHSTQVTGLDIVAIARHPSAFAQNKEVCQSLERHWHRISNQCRKS